MLRFQALKTDFTACTQFGRKNSPLTGILRLNPIDYLIPFFTAQPGQAPCWISGLLILMNHSTVPDSQPEPSWPFSSLIFSLQADGENPLWCCLSKLTWQHFLTAMTHGHTHTLTWYSLMKLTWSHHFWHTKIQVCTCGNLITQNRDWNICQISLCQCHLGPGSSTRGHPRAPHGVLHFLCLN